MTYRSNQFQEFARLLATHTPLEGLNFTAISNFGTYKASSTQVRSPTIEESTIMFTAQGRKVCYAAQKTYEVCAENFFIFFFPMSVETEIVEASPEKPLLLAGIRLDLGRMADMLLKIEQVDGVAPAPVSADPSGIFSAPLSEALLQALIRLMKLLDNPRDASILGESMIDEIYYRLLVDDRDGDLKYLLQQRGHIQRIGKAVKYIHQNLNEPVSVEKLAKMVNMSSSGFHRNFKEVMHLSPLQYAKSVKLFKAQTLIREGKNVSEAGYLVGYHSPAQFSREYKRHFGFAPSAT
jgi:AraC-like DNA-binding protein